MTEIEPLLSHNDTLAGRCELLSRAEGVLDVLGEIKDEIRDEVEGEIRGLADQAGGTFSFRFGDDGSATIAGGKRKVRVTDPEAHRPWAEERGFGWNEQATVKVKDSELVAHASDRLTRLIDDTGRLHEDDVPEFLTAAKTLVESLSISHAPVFAKDHTDKLLEYAEPHDGKLVDVETGEVVPGVKVTYSNDYLRVSTDKPTRERTATMLRSRLTPELGT